MPHGICKNAVQVGSGDIDWGIRKQPLLRPRTIR